MTKQTTTYVFALLLFFSLHASTTHAQGKFAGALKGLVGKSYTDSRNIKGLKNWQFREGSLITPVDDPEMMTVDVFQKGTTCAVLFSYMEDTASHVFVIVDVIEVKNVPKGWEVRGALCRQNTVENVEIVALVKPNMKEFSTTVKQAWRLDRDKRRVEALSTKGIDCINGGDD